MRFHWQLLHADAAKKRTAAITACRKTMPALKPAAFQMRLLGDANMHRGKLAILAMPRTLSVTMSMTIMKKTAYEGQDYHARMTAKDPPPRSSKGKIVAGILAALALSGIFLLFLNFDSAETVMESEIMLELEDAAPALFPIKYWLDASAANSSDEIHAAFEAWQELNPKFDFYQVSEKKDSTLKIYSRMTANAGEIKMLGDDHSGYWSGSHIYDESENEWFVLNAEIYYYLGDYDCNGIFVPFASEYIQDIVEHEIGHHLGIDHTLDESHLMHGDDGLPAGMFDNLGYSMPGAMDYSGAYAGYKAINDRIDELNEDIDRLSEEMYRLDEAIEKLDSEIEPIADEYSKYPEIIENDAEYRQAVLLYDAMNELNDERNDMIEEYNQLVEEHNHLAEESVPLADKANCFPGIIQDDA